MKRLTVESIKCEFGTVKLNQNQLNYVVSKVSNPKFKMVASTDDIICKRIKSATRWEMKRMQLFCRFAYRFGLVKL